MLNLFNARPQATEAPAPTQDRNKILVGDIAVDLSYGVVGIVVSIERGIVTIEALGGVFASMPYPCQPETLRLVERASDIVF